MNLERFQVQGEFAPGDLGAGKVEDGGRAENAYSATRRARSLAKITGTFGMEGETPKETLSRLMVGETRSVREISIASGLDRKTIATIADGFEIPRPRSGTPECEAIRLRNVRRHWADPEKRKATVAKIHTPEAATRTSKALREYYRRSPGAGFINNRRMKEIAARRRFEMLEANFGTGNLKEILQLLTTAGLDQSAIGEKLSMTPQTLRKWAKEVGVKLKSAPKRRSSLRKKDQERKELLGWAKEEDLMKFLTKKQARVLEELYGGEAVVLLRTVAGHFGTSPQDIDICARAAISKLEKLKRGERVRSG